MNLVLIVSDSLRADYLGCYGSSWVRTPSLDELATQSVVFEDHHAASFPTMPARADFFLGKWTFTYRGWEPLPDTERTLATILTEAGYATVGVVDTPFYTTNGFAYDRGFTHFADLDTQRRGGPEAPERPQLIKRPRRSELDHAAPRTFALAERYLEKVYDQPFFLLVDTWDPHEPWDPPDWYIRQYKADYDGRKVQPPYGPWRERGLTEDDLETARACYAGEVTMVDRWVGRLLERLDSLGIADRTVVVFTSDHGFYFGEHGYLGKMVEDPGQSLRWLRSPLHKEITHVPLLIRVPGQSPRRVPVLTSAVDLMPTLTELILGDIPEDVQGRSLTRLLNGEEMAGRDYVITSPPLTNPGDPIRVVDDVMRDVGDYLPATLSTHEWTLIHSSGDRPSELYHLPSDPTQEHDVAESEPAKVRELITTYIRFLEEAGTSEHYIAPRRVSD